ncbi:hypothetical protein HPB49_026542 [Dermacentor silvarum]|nr:hypothetical protein HPB49_026542 [Dermacentor silvarum]
MWVHAALATFIVFNIYANLFKLFQTDTSARNIKTPAVLLPGWRHCAVCAMNVPPRSHHCSVCNECILKHDHHCMFTGRCIGFYNQRYFVVALLYMTVGLFYSLSYKCPYVLEMLGGINLATFLHMVAPHFGLLLGFVDVWLFLCNLVNLVELVVFFLCAYLLMVELICVARNQTTYEKSHGIRTYSMGLRKNLKETLGTSWFLVWLSPWVQSPVSGDGMYFDGHVVCVDGKKQDGFRSTFSYNVSSSAFSGNNPGRPDKKRGGMVCYSQLLLILAMWHARQRHFGVAPTVPPVIQGIAIRGKPLQLFL